MNGAKLKIVACDTQNSKPDVSKSCVNNVVSKGAVIGMVTCDVDFATAAIQQFLAKRMLTIAPCIGTDQMGPKRFGALGKLAFSYGNVAQDEGAAMAEYAYNVKHWTTAVTVTDNLLVYFKNVVQAFTSRFKQLGGKIVDAESFTSFDKTIGNVVSRVNGQKADVIVTSTGFADWPAFMAGIRSLNNQTPIMNSWAGDGTFWYPKSPPVSNYWYVTYASVFGDDPSALVKRMISQLTGLDQPPATGGFVTGAAVDRRHRRRDQAGEGLDEGSRARRDHAEVQGPAHDLRQGELLADAAQRLRARLPRDGGAELQAEVRPALHDEEAGHALRGVGRRRLA